MVVNKSNGIFFQVFEIPPLANVGWEIRVISSQSWRTVQPHKITMYGKAHKPFSALTPVMVIPKFISASMQQTISDVGAGSVTLDMDMDMWKTTLPDGRAALSILDYEHLWQVYENGTLRFEFLGQDVSEEFVTPDGTRAITVSGPDGAEVLNWFSVTSPFYPGKAPAGQPDKYFFRLAAMDAWSRLFYFGNNNGFITWVDLTFYSNVDSAGKQWSDNPPPKPKIDMIESTLSSDINFFFGEATLTDTAKGLLAGMCVAFEHMTSPQVTVVGHTDSVGSHAFNQTLSEQRARNAANYIREKVPQVVLTVSGKGETQPIATNSTAFGREKNRRVVVTYPKGPPPVETPFLKYEVGQTLLELLNDWTGQNPDQPSPIRAEWRMLPNMRLAVIEGEFGQHREGEVVFYEGSTALFSKGRQRHRNDIRNHVALQINTGGYVIASDAASIDRWNKRLKLSRQPIGNETYLAKIAQTMLDIDKDETGEWTIKVAPYAAGRRVFQDYDLGDWIGVSRHNFNRSNFIEAFRVMGITMQVSGNNEVDLELTLQSARQSALRKLHQRLTTLMDKKDAPEVYIQDEEPVYARIGDIWTPLTDQTY